MSNDQLISNGNTFFRAVVLAFVLVYALYMTTEHPFDDTPMGVIGKHRRELVAALSRAETDQATALSTLVTGQGVSVDGKVDAENEVESQVLSQGTKIIELREKVVQSYLEEANLRKAQDVQYAVPGLPGSFSEKTVALLFPFAMFLGILRLAAYRLALLRNLDELVASEIPLWAAPLPARLDDLGFGRWIMINTAGLTTIILVIVLLLEYIWDTSVRLVPAGYQIFPSVSITVGALCLAVYGVFLIRSMWGRV